MLHALIARARRLGALDEAMRRQLGPELGGHCRLANVRDSTAVLHVDSPAWSARIRFLTPQLLAFFHQQRGCEAVQQIKITVRPPGSQRQLQAESPSRLSQAGAAVIRSLALATEESALREALLHLAEHGERR